MDKSNNKTDSSFQLIDRPVKEHGKIVEGNGLSSEALPFYKIKVLPSAFRVQQEQVVCLTIELWNYPMIMDWMKAAW